MRIEWGVDQYPKSRLERPKEKTRNTRQAISFMILFGDDKLDSGFFLAPDLHTSSVSFLEKMKNPKIFITETTGRKVDVISAYPATALKEKLLLQRLIYQKNSRNYSGRSLRLFLLLAIEVDVQKTESSNGRHSKAFLKQIQLSR